MKQLLLLAAILFVGCTQQQSDQLTQQQKDQIKKEVSDVLDSLKTRVERLDGNGVLEYIAGGAVAFDYTGAWVEDSVVRKRWMNLSNAMSAIKSTTVATQVVPLTNEYALCSWQIRVQSVLKSGVAVAADPEAYSFIFRRIDGKWKIIYSHESATVTIQPSVKK